MVFVAAVVDWFSFESARRDDEIRIVNGVERAVIQTGRFVRLKFTRTPGQ